MSLWKNYQLPHTVIEALRVLEGAPGPARIVAGGTDLLLDLQQGRHPLVDTLVDVTSVDEMTCLEVRENRLFIGAAVPLKRVNTSPLVFEHAEALVEACHLIGGPQVRNTATLGGNVAHALPAADGTIAMMALDAQVEIASQAGRRFQPLSSLFVGPGKSALDQTHDLLVGFYLPLKGAHEGSAFARVMRPQGVALPILNMAAWVRREGDTVADVRLSVGPAGPTPRRGNAAEDMLREKPFSTAAAQQALEALLGEVRYRTSPHRASADYRRLLSGPLMSEVLENAWQRAGSING